MSKLLKSKLVIIKEASLIFDVVINEIKEVIKNPTKFKSIFKYSNCMEGKGYLVNNKKYKNLSINAKDLKIYFCNKDDEGNLANYMHDWKTKTKHNIQLMILPRKAITEELVIKSLINILKNNKDKLYCSIIHEYTHLCDNVIYHDKKYTVSLFTEGYSNQVLNEMEIGNFDNYFTVPEEFNAFTNEGLALFYKKFNRLKLPQLPIEDILVFLANKFWDKEFLISVFKNKKLKKKLLNTIYAAYKELYNECKTERKGN